jgi:ABC-type multidrug transport system ATPase subunit
MDLSRKPHHELKLLEADSIWLEYKHRKVLQNIYIRVEKGEIAGLLGRNGSGKSSLLEIIYGIRRPQNSSVRINGKFIRKLYQHEDFMAYLPQNQFVPAYLKVKEAFRLYRSRLNVALEYFPEIDQLLDRHISQLSGGQQRLVETMMVISSPAAFLILDEPFSNLMPLHVDILKSWLSALKETKAIIITDHYYRDVLAISDHIYLLDMGGQLTHLHEPMKQLKDFGYIV